MWFLPILNFFTNPKVLIAIIAAVVIGWIAFTFKQNEDFKQTIAQQRTEITQLHDNIDQLNQNLKLQQDDINRLDKIAQARVARQHTEAQFNNEVAQIPQTTDHPFADPNLLDYAHKLRDFQHQSNSTTTNNVHR